MNKTALIRAIREKQSFLCVGLDTDLEKLPSHFARQPSSLFEFNRAIIDATLEYTVSYKLNLAFYEAYGRSGWEAFEQTIEYLSDKDVFTIADAKRGDIGNTSRRYAKAFFEAVPCDAITVNPYMGHDSVVPFLGFRERWVIALGLTSNPGAGDIELQKLESGEYVYERVMKQLVKMAGSEALMFVVGATQRAHFKTIRTIAPDHFLLVPGIGAQGAQVNDLRALLNRDVGLLVNSSRQVIYASSGGDFARAANEQAAGLQRQMATLLQS